MLLVIRVFRTTSPVISDVGEPPDSELQRFEESQYTPVICNTRNLRVLVQIGMAYELMLSEADWLPFCKLSCQYSTPDHCWVGPEAARNRKLPFVNFLRQLDSYDDPTRVIETLEAEHGLQAKLHPPVVVPTETP